MKGVHWFLVGLAHRKDHHSLYVNAVDSGRYRVQQYEERLGKVKLGSASIGSERIEDVDLDVLEVLMRRAHEITDPDPELDGSSPLSAVPRGERIRRPASGQSGFEAS